MRKPRIVRPGACYHVTSRCANREFFLRGREDFALALLRRAVRKVFVNRERSNPSDQHAEVQPINYSVAISATILLEYGPMKSNPASQWTIDKSFSDENRFKRFNKKHPLETASCFANLGRVLNHLRAGEPFGSFRLNFFRHEFGNVWRIAQTGVPSAKETRLYILVAVIQTSLYVLTIGDKDSQQGDLVRCKELEATIVK